MAKPVMSRTETLQMLQSVASALESQNRALDSLNKGTSSAISRLQSLTSRLRSGRQSGPVELAALVDPLVLAKAKKRANAQRLTRLSQTRSQARVALVDRSSQRKGPSSAVR